MNDSQMLETLAMTDAYAPHEPLPASTWTRDTALTEIERRAIMQTEKRPAPQTPLRRRPSGWLVAAGAAIAVFVLIGGFVWLVSGTGGDVVVEPQATALAGELDDISPLGVIHHPRAFHPEAVVALVLALELRHQAQTAHRRTRGSAVHVA